MYISAPSLCSILTGLSFETCLYFPKFLLHGEADISSLYEVHLYMFTYKKHWGVGVFVSREWVGKHQKGQMKHFQYH